MNISKFTIIFIFIFMSVYNYSGNGIRPTEIMLPFILVIVVFYVKILKDQILFGALLLGYLFINFTIMNYLFSGGNENFRDAIGVLRFWFYFILAISMGKILSQIDLLKYKKTLIFASFISLSIIISVYFLSSIGNQFIITYVVGTTAEKVEEILSINNKVSGVSLSIVFFMYILLYIFNAKKYYYFLMLIISLSIFYFSGSRQFILTIFILWMLLSFNIKKFIPYLLIFSLISYSIVRSNSQIIIDNLGTAGIKLIEIIYFYTSSSIYVRLSAFFEGIIEVFKINPFTGPGIGAVLTLKMKGTSFDYLNGILYIDDSLKYDYITHCPDNSFLMPFVDGGILLFSILFYILIKSLIYVYVNDKKLGYVFIFIVLINGMLSSHLITNYTLAFILSFIYYYSFNLKRRKAIEKKD